MKIELRSRMLQSGNRTLYLEFYEKGGKRTYESLNLFLIPERNDEDRRVNEATLSHALKLKAERALGIEREKEGKEVNEIKSSRIFAEWMDEYLTYLKSDGRFSEAYCLHMRSTIRIVKSFLDYIRRPRLQMAKVDKDFYKSFLTYVNDVYRNTKSPDHPKTLSDRTKLLIQTDLNAMLNHAVKQGQLSKNPFYELELRERFKKTASDREYLTVDELKRLEQVETGSPRTKQTFLFCCFTGLRHSDLTELRWQNIQKTDTGYRVYIPAMKKTKKPVIIPLNKKALEWLPERGSATEEDLVFPNLPIISSADRALKHMAKRAGIQKSISFHCSRHSCATLTLAAGGDLYTTSRMLGHTNIHSTEIYAKVMPETKVAAINLLNSAFG